ncbi:MAG: SHOCT domain-containing protein [bacterium]|nr:SHOCT domain-containing protein [bacterium]MDZ4295755.1 SHOCT domain-containing protein [Patescibacteria group bacterium]
MKKFLAIIFVFGLTLVAAGMANAQVMGGFSNTSVDWDEVVEHTLREEKEGKEVWDKLQAKELACADLNDEQFGVLGEYFMGQMMGDSHASMNAMMMQMHGEEGEEQIHVVMGKRLSGCDTSAAVPGISGGWMPMMNMMWGGWSSPFGNNSTNNMMNFGFGPFGSFGWIFMILWWVLIIAGITALIKWLTSQSHGTRNHEKSALDVLKERYAKGEIDKKEFEEKKKDLS